MRQLLKGSIFDPLDANLPQDEKVKFLVSDTYCRILTDFARGITGNTKVQTVILPPMSSKLGYTDGNTFYVCTVHETFADQAISDITQFILAVAAHEPWHGKYTNFTYWQRRIRSIPNGQSLYKWLFNALCDARIERIGCLEFPGVKVFVVRFREFLFKQAANDTKMTEAQKLLNNILFFATCGKVRYAMSEKMNKAFEQCRPLIISARRSDTTEDCDKYVNQIFNIVYPLTKSETTMPQNITGEMSKKSQNHKDFRGNANTGGADSIVFDEDTDEDTDEENSSNADETSDTSSKSNSSQKNAQKSSNKSSSQNSNDGDNDTEGDDIEGYKNNASAEGNDSNGNDTETGTNQSDAEPNEVSDDKNPSATNLNASGSEEDTDSIDNDVDNDCDRATASSAKQEDSSSKGSSTNDDERKDKAHNTLSDLEQEVANEMIRQSLSNAASSFVNEQAQKNADSQTMRNIERDSSSGTCVKCAKPNPQNAPLYTEVVANAAPIISHLITTMKRVIDYNQDEVIRRTSTGFLDAQSLPYAHRGTCFAQRHEKSDESELFISFVLDCSGSMVGQRNINTLMTTVIILEACNALKIPVSVKGFSSNYSSCCDITHFWDYKYRNKSCRYNLSQLYASGGTPLAEALKYEREYLSKVKRADKICFVLTDGAPNFTSAAIDEYNKLRKNALVYGVAIGDDLPCLTNIFGKDRIIDARDLKSLPQQLGKIIRCNLIKQ